MNRECYDIEAAKKYYPGFDPSVYQLLFMLDGYLPSILYGIDAHKRIQEVLDEANQ